MYPHLKQTDFYFQVHKCHLKPQNKTGTDMSTGKKWITAGLAFRTERDIDIVSLGNRLAGALERHGNPVRGIRILSDGGAVIKTREYDVWIRSSEDQPFVGMRARAPLLVEIRLSRPGPQPDAPTTATYRMLVRLVAAAQHTLQADFIRWLSTDVLLTRDEFAMATASLAPAGDTCRHPRKAQNRSPLPAIEDTVDALHGRLRERDARAALDHAARPEPATDGAQPFPAGDMAAQTGDDVDGSAALRLSAWIVSFAVALFALPVGAALIVFNLLRGESLRLTSQTAALTGTFIALQTFGTTAQAMSVLQSLVQ